MWIFSCLFHQLFRNYRELRYKWVCLKQNLLSMFCRGGQARVNAIVCVKRLREMKGVWWWYGWGLVTLRQVGPGGAFLLNQSHTKNSDSEFKFGWTHPLPIGHISKLRTWHSLCSRRPCQLIDFLDISISMTGIQSSPQAFETMIIEHCCIKNRMIHLNFSKMPRSVFIMKH